MKAHPKRSNPYRRKIIPATIAACGLAATATVSGPGLAELADLADVPLANSPSDAVLPNLMYVLDDSGSMMWDYMPDYIYSGPGAGSGTRKNCKTLSSCGTGGSSCSPNIADVVCMDGSTPSDWGEPPYYSPQFNQIYYNPDVTYEPSVNSSGVSLGNSSPTAAIKDYYLDSSTTNLKTGYPEIYYCVSGSASFTASISGTVLTVTSVSSGTLGPGYVVSASGITTTTIVSNGTGSGGTGTYNIDVSQSRSSRSMTASFTNPTSSQLADSTKCRRNGINNIPASPNNYFLYWSNSATNGAYPQGSSTGNAFINQVVSNTGNPYYFKISPHEYCSDENLINCALANSDGSAPSGFPFPAPVRFCTGTSNAASAAAVSDTASSTSPKCRATFGVGTYIYPRYGRFTRVDLTSSTATYAKSATAVRPDCGAGPTCTYDQEVQNFANWYTYYRTRMSMMKTATARAFRTIDDRYRVGFITINPSGSVKSVDASGDTTSATTVLSSAVSPSDVRYLPIAKFDAAQKSLFYSTLFAMSDHGSTPLRTALSRVGRHFAGITTGINLGMSTDPMTNSCQQNFALLTTDGYWNDGSGSATTTTGSAIGNPDGTPTTGTPVYVSRATGTLDGDGTKVTTTSPSIDMEQALCTGNATVTWSNGTNSTACGCSGSQKKILQRTRTISSIVTATDGINGGSTASISASFTTIAGCDANVATTRTHYTETQEQRVSTSATTSFTSLITGLPAGSQRTGQCGNSQRNSVIRRVLVGELISTVTDGGSPTTTFSTSSVTFTTRSLTGSNCTSGSLTAASGSLVVNSGPTTSSNGGTTITSSMITLSPNPQSSAGGQTVSTTFGGTSDTLADVAMYYYKTDLRTTGPLAPDNVPTSDKDVAPHQHMVTFTLGLGLKGLMNYRSDYESALTGDFAKIKNADTTCSWSATAGETCNWPNPSSSDPTTLDDLWHAAVNGRGTFYSAADPNSLADGLSGALSALKIQTAAASASATSSPNITETDNFIYSSTFRTVKWDGQITAQRIDTNTGNVLPAIVWEAQALLDAKVSDSTDTRSIWKFDGSGSAGSNRLAAFTWANMSNSSSGCSISGEQACFANKGSALAQYSTSLNSTQQTTANTGSVMVGWLRGQTQYEGSLSTADAVYRDRDHVLGDAVNATPAYVRAPTFNFQDAVTPTYATFKAAQGARQGVLYIAANDGMLHAFNGDTTPNSVSPSAPAAAGGSELWAYIPRMVFPNLHKLATESWDKNHKYFVDGSPQVMDVFQATSAGSTTGTWKTILVGGLNKGGKGFYALDITDPNSPKGLWEICNDSSLCAISDPDLGYSYGNAVIAKRAYDSKWVVVITSGINNYDGVNGTGHGYLYVLDAFTGQILQKVDTGVGDTTTPAGLSKLSAYADNFNIENKALYIYGGDLLGNLWRFDMSVDPPAVLKVAELADSGGKPQSVTSRPELGVITDSGGNVHRVVFVGTGRYLGNDDLEDPATLSPALDWAYQQSFYAIKDKFNNAATTGHGNIRTSSPGLVQQTLIDNGTTRSTSNLAVDWAAKDGWYIDFNPSNTSPGERVNLDPQLVLGTIVVVTNVPNNNACTVGGDSFIYQFNYSQGTYVASAPGQVAGTKFTGQITVGLVVVRLPSGVFKGVATGATGTKTPVGVNVGGTGGAGRRVSWRELVK